MMITLDNAARRPGYYSCSDSPSPRVFPKFDQRLMALIACSKSGIQSAPGAACPHRRMPAPSTAKVPPVCQRLPDSVGLFQTPSSFPSLKAFHIPCGFKTCQKLDIPSPHSAYVLRSESTITSTWPVPPTDSSHLSVDALSL